jgi:hypothetical protein
MGNANAANQQTFMRLRVIAQVLGPGHSLHKTTRRMREPRAAPGAKFGGFGMVPWLFATCRPADAPLLPILQGFTICAMMTSLAVQERQKALGIYVPY